MPRNQIGSAIMKPFVILALPGMYLFYKYNQYKQQQQEQSRRKVTERELAQLNHKIDKLLTKLEENEPEMATSSEDECVICCNAKATMQTSPCGHRVVCRKCFVKTIQMAVSQRLLPLRCVICRAKILRLKQSSGHGLSKSWLMPSSASSYSMSAKSWTAGGSNRNCWNDKNWVPSSASQYSMASRNVHSSASMYSMTSGSSSLSGMSSVSSATNSSVGSSSSTAPERSQPTVRQPNGSLKKSQQYSMKMRIQEYNESGGGSEEGDKPSRLSPIVEFQREHRAGREKATSSSTRIRCAQKIVTQLESGPGPSDKKWTKAGRPTTSSSTASSASFFKSSLKSGPKEDKKRDKSEEKRKGKSQSETTTETTEAKEIKDKKETTKGDKKEMTKGDKKETTKGDKKETTKGDKKKNKQKETEKRDEGNGKTEKKETEMKTSKQTTEKPGKPEKETHL